ncbi:hypothetical protein GCM10022600_07680 [Qipengyuania pelagi]|jgi:hypothetical protein|uniref:Uncharacterized protein n=1 Tax=Qipengyuania pelagi TaxID=994320 RepID=A0A844YAF9_9SPHN|nr:hypothetical protein [Qipengyuania pelagi]MXO54357.1 hypothetical protein [Qipengyuania pelagi]|tara:strand:+ start:155 stop:802 length:648 start_codon:yes stop_codon:yes gene_type:complete
MEQLAHFDDVWLEEFRNKSKLPNDVALIDLQNELRKIGRHYRRIIETTPCDLKGSPFNKTLTQRGDWLQREVIRPTEKLLAALASENRAHFSTWPYEERFDDMPDYDRLADQLRVLLESSTELLSMVRSEQVGDAATNQELRFYIFKDIFAAVRKHLPKFVPKQGSYDLVENEKTKRFVGPFPDAIRHIYQHITGRDEQLVRLIRMVVKDPNWDL